MPELRDNAVTAGGIFQNTIRIFEEAGLPEPEPDAWLLFENAFSTSRTAYLLDREKRAEPAQVELLNGYIRERLEGRPVQYILGEAWFCGLKFRVTPDVLIPRFDTEILVEEAGKAVRPGCKVLDLCTGSGCIIISMAKLYGVEGTGTDISKEALETAVLNDKELGAGGTFIESDIYENVPEKYDMIISNPPYIRTAEIGGLQQEVRHFEPRLALDGGPDGLDFYRKIAAGAREHLAEDGCIFLEIGYDQAEDVKTILEENGFPDASVVKDLAGNDRVIKAKMRSIYV